jgi:hypothetical protein
MGVSPLKQPAASPALPKRIELTSASFVDPVQVSYNDLIKQFWHRERDGLSQFYAEDGFVFLAKGKDSLLVPFANIKELRPQ